MLRDLLQIVQTIFDELDFTSKNVIALLKLNALMFIILFSLILMTFFTVLAFITYFSKRIIGLEEFLYRNIEENQRKITDYFRRRPSS